MADIKLFQICGENVIENKTQEIPKERSIQNLIEKNLEVIFNIRFLKSEFPFQANDGKSGRMDTLGLDENNCPVIIEYKRSNKDNVINQGLFYMDWLKSHKKDFEWIVLETFDKELVKKIDWTQPRLICIANDFNRYDEFAIRQLPVNIDLIRYRLYENQILFELTNNNQNTTITNTEKYFEQNQNEGNTLKQEKSVTEKYNIAKENVKIIYTELEKYILSLNDDIQKNVLIHYIAFKKIKNFACIEIFNNHIKLFLTLNPTTFIREQPIMRDMTNIGHRGTGNLMIMLEKLEDLEKVKDLIELSYQYN